MSEPLDREKSPIRFDSQETRVEIESTHERDAGRNLNESFVRFSFNQASDNAYNPVRVIIYKDDYPLTCCK